MALAFTATKPKPGGIIKPFCELPKATSAPNASMSNGLAASEATTSTTYSAGWAAASMARRTAARSLVTPLAVSVCTTKTALMRWLVSSRRARSIAATSKGWPS